MKISTRYSGGRECAERNQHSNHCIEILSTYLYLDVEREERQINYYKNKLEAAETKMRDFERCFNDTEGSDLIKKLIDVSCGSP